MCDVVPLYLILHNLHFHSILWEDCGPGREGLRHLHGTAGWVSTCRALLFLHCLKSWECLKTFQPQQGCAGSAKARTGLLQMAALGALRSFWYLQQVLASAAAMCSLGLLWRLGLTGESFCSAGDNHAAVPPAYFSDQLPFVVVIFSFFFPHMGSFSASGARRFYVLVFWN